MTGRRPDPAIAVVVVAALAAALLGVLAIAGAGPFGEDPGDGAAFTEPLRDLAEGDVHEGVSASRNTGGWSLSIARADGGLLVARALDPRGRPSGVGGCAQADAPVVTCGGGASSDGVLVLTGLSAPEVAQVRVRLADGRMVPAVVGAQAWLARIDGGPTSDEPTRAGPEPQSVVALDASGREVHWAPIGGG